MIHYKLRSDIFTCYFNIFLLKNPNNVPLSRICLNTFAPNKKRKNTWVRTHSRELHSHLANEQDTTGTGQSPAQDVFLKTFGDTGSAPTICICPLGKMY